jgi:hypothetical protein
MFLPSFLFLLQNSYAAPSFQPFFTDDEGFSESFTAIADLRDGTYILVQLLFSNAGFGDYKGACRVLIVPKDAKGYNKSINVGSKEWTANAKNVSVETCSLRTEGATTSFIASAENISASLTITSKMTDLQFPEQDIKKADFNGFYHQDIWFTSAPVSATYTTPEGKKTSSGFAYLDHGRSNMLLPNVAKQWVRFRGFYGDEPLLLQIRVPPKESSRGWFYHKEKLTKLNSSDVVISSKGGLQIQGAHNAQITTNGPLFVYKPIEAYGAAGSIAKTFIGNPITTTYNATLKGTINGEEVQIKGILEESYVE